jgi:tetratricopeptide (TPR) repeat protein
MKTINFASFKINQMNKNKFLISSILLFFNALIVNSQSLQDGIKQLENENYSAALNTFTQLNVSNPKNPIFAYYIGEVHYALENFDAAKTAYQIGLNASSKCDECRIGLGKLELNNGRIAEAKKLFESALKGNNKNHQIIALVGDAYLYNKKPLPDDALEYLTRARDLDPKVARYWIHLGDAQLAKSDLGSAMTSYETAVEKDKSDPETYVKMARIWSASKKYDLGIEKLEAAIVLNPEYAIAYKELYEQLI